MLVMLRCGGNVGMCCWWLDVGMVVSCASSCVGDDVILCW